VEEGRLLGSLTDGDARRWILANGSLDEPVSSVMNKNPRFVRSGQTRTARALINRYELLAIPVVDASDKVVDMIFWNEETDKPQTEKIALPVVIMAGGKGERLLPYTSIVPKPLIPIGEKTISELVIESFRKYGCQEFYFTLNYRKNMIKAYFDDSERDYSIKYVEEDEPLGTGGSLYCIKEELNSTFFVSNCDILLDVDYADVVKFHKKSQNDITIITSLKKYVIPYGTINLNAEGRIESLQEKPSSDYLVNTGVYVIEAEVLRYLEKKEFIHITDLIEKCIVSGRNVGTYPVSDSAWMDMGQFEEMDRMKKNMGREY
jgi:NDP-sugar pyrophosphorylase family protein